MRTKNDYLSGLFSKPERQSKHSGVGVKFLRVIQDMPLSVLFVCTGNICRSPTAEGVFRYLAGLRGMSDRFDVDSAGMHGLHAGDSPDPRSVFTARRRGVDIGDLRARALRASDFNRFHLILGMDTTHLVDLQRHCARAGVVSAETGLFMEHAGLGVRDVPDPYYGSGECFEQVFDMIEQGCIGLLDRFVAVIQG
jgi:protein-tyrosine phosphatase